MPQIFTASADTWLRASVLGAFLTVFGGGLMAGGLVQSNYVTRVGWAVAQPAPFSHAHHVGELGLDCRYCHTSVETDANAGFPPTSTCMTCHSQLYTGAPMLAPIRASLASGQPVRWNRVSEVPDYVFFNHAIHVKSGVACVSCHGRIDKMPMTARAHAFEMRFCLDCHRNPAPALRPPDQITRMDWTGWDGTPAAHAYSAARFKALHPDTVRLANCSTCHR